MPLCCHCLFVLLIVVVIVLYFEYEGSMGALAFKLHSILSDMLPVGDVLDSGEHDHGFEPRVGAFTFTTLQSVRW